MSEARGDQKIREVELHGFSIVEGFKRGLLMVNMENGQSLRVASQSEQGEHTGSSEYVRQRDEGIKLAVRNGVGFTEVDLDLAQQVREERARLASNT